MFLAKNGVSEKMVKVILSIKRKADEEEEEGAAQPAQHAPATDPIRLKAVRQTVLVPESVAKATANTQVILLDPRYVVGSRAAQAR